MKKLIPILLAVFALVSCEKDPDMDKLDNEYLVFTSHDTSTKFNDFSTYYIPDSILIIGDKKDPEYWKDENAQIIINAFKTKMNAAGYTAANKDEADLGLQVSYVASTYYFHGYYNDGPWWGYYPGYWYPGYWGGNWEKRRASYRGSSEIQGSFPIEIYVSGKYDARDPDSAKCHRRLLRYVRTGR